ncbi:MAG: GGDEF domain-containing protein [Phycisphaeraceae bacterium]|nr:MAG: GGDEF domain-containing protein [Phycisphaeraceae bacterium]
MTVPAQLTSDEPIRLDSLRQLNVIDTPIEERFERITRLVRKLLGVPIAAISLVESDRQWFKSIAGLDICETSRDVSFCAHGLHSDNPLIIPDAREDPRFCANPLVTDDPGIVFYAGIPLHAPGQARIGMLCAIDTVPRTPELADLETLRDLAKMAAREIATPPAAPAAAEARSLYVHERRSLVDPTTRLWSPGGIAMIAQATFEEASNRLAGRAIVRIRLDGLGSIAHGAHESVLRSTGRTLLSTLRETDIVGRLGENEFLALITPSDTEAFASGVMSLAVERVNASLATELPDTQPVRACAGVYHCDPVSSMGFVEAMARADRKMPPPAARPAAA